MGAMALGERLGGGLRILPADGPLWGQARPSAARIGETLGRSYALSAPSGRQGAHLQILGAAAP